MYNIGDRIVYPMHGAGIIEAIEEREVLDEVNKYYILRMPYDDMTVMLPISGIAADSIRDVISPEEADKVIKYFDDFFEEVSSNWNKRYRENTRSAHEASIYYSCDRSIYGWVRLNDIFSYPRRAEKVPALQMCRRNNRRF